MPLPNVLFLTLKVFSFTGGIEKVCRSIAYALQQLSNNGVIKSSVFSMYDDKNSLNTSYIHQENFHGFKQRKTSFALQSVYTGMRQEVVILSHINLLLIGYLIKLLSPKTKVYLLAHGIEVWKPLNKLKRTALQKMDRLIAVSNFTANTIINKHHINPKKVIVLNNCLDPFFVFPKNFSKPAYLLERYQLTKNQPILFSLCRLTSSEKYKGYEHTVNILPDLIKEYPDLVYLLAGKYSRLEEARITQLIKSKNLESRVKLIGFISEAELTDHFLLGDVFALPSKKEGFGIVFIEAMANGCHVVAGNKDGSIDATKNGVLGKLVDPDNNNELKEAILGLLSKVQSEQEKLKLQQEVISFAGYQQYEENLKKLILHQTIN